MLPALLAPSAGDATVGDESPPDGGGDGGGGDEGC